MDISTLQRLQEFEEKKQYYDALQYYRTKLTRCFRQSAVKSEAAAPIIQHAVDFFLKDKQYQCAVDIATQYLECLSKNKTAMTEDIFLVISEIVRKLIVAVKEITDSADEEILRGGTGKCVDLAIQWTKQMATETIEKTYGSLILHGLLAETFLNEDRYEFAKSHFLLSNKKAELAELLQRETLRDGEDSYDMGITEAVLQLLCLDRFPFALEVFDTYLTPKKHPYDHPLLNFLHLLFQAIRTENKIQYTDIIEIYKDELERSSNFVGYLTKIGNLYFGTRSTTSFPGLGNILSGLMGSQEEKPATSHLSSKLPQSVSVPKPPSTKPIEKKPMDMEDDLD